MMLGGPGVLYGLPPEEQVDTLAWAFARAEDEALAAFSLHAASQQDRISMHNAVHAKTKQETDHDKMAAVNAWLEGG